MGHPLLPVALFGGALLILSGGKKKKKAKRPRIAPIYQAPPQEAVPEVYRAPPSSGGASTWFERQKALKRISQIEFGSVPLCAKCDPGSIDGKPGPKTLAAIRAFQAIAGLSVDGNWSTEEDLAMFNIFSAVEQDKPIRCDPLVGYPAPFACFASEEGFVLDLARTAEPKTPGSLPQPDPSVEPDSKPLPQYAPDELLVTDPECNYVVYQDNRWFPEQRRRAIAYALDGMTDAAAALEIHESMMADFAPLCLSLGRDGVGPGLKTFWDVNAGWINSLLKNYEALPQLLEEDAKKFGFL